MHDPTLLIELIARGFTCIPLAEGSKTPLVPWKQFQTRAASHYEMLVFFARFPRADIGIVTGPASNAMVLDFDSPPFVATDPHYVETPNGRHYYYRYHPGDQHGIRVAPNIDIPWIAKLYGIPTINETRIPIQPTLHAPRPNVQESGGEPIREPDPRAYSNCEFIRWFRERREQPWDGRYPLARAYASNVAPCPSADRSLGPNYRHERDIYDSIGRPITCAAIVKAGFNCPFFDYWTDTCTKASGVTTPYGLALRASTNR